MSHAAHQWVDRLSHDTLPVMRRSLTRVRDLLNQSSVNHRTLAAVIARDPGFSLHLIRLFNHLPKAPKEPVSKIELAIPLLGMAQVEQASRTLPCLEDHLQGPPQRGLITCYSRAAHAAIYANALTLRRRDIDEGAVYTAALLHDIGEMALWSREPDRMRQVQQLLHQGDGHEDAALEVFGCTLQEISAGLSEAWGLPELVRTAQGLTNSYLPRPLSVMLAAALARESSLGWQRPGTLDGLELLSEFLEIPFDEAVAWLHRQAAEAARQLQTLSIPLPAFHLLHDDEPAVKKVPSADRAATKATPAPSTNEPAAEPSIQPAPATLQQTQPEPAASASSTAPLQQLIATTLKELQREHGLQRAMFAMLNKERTELRARLVSEQSAEGKLRAFQVDLRSPTLFSLLLKKPQAISLTPANAEKYQHLIPDPLHTVINSRQCLVMSVFLHNKPIGLFYADNGPKQAITPQQFANFKAVCQRTIQTLS
ncbi:MAG: HDOD domain-containing protein [Candidatus Thiodiazotropha sp.]